MKKIKVCEHCEAKFHNRRSLRLHLLHFHDIDIFVKQTRVTFKEGKPQRRIRLMEHVARVKKEEQVTNNKRIGRTRTGGKPKSELAFMRRMKPHDLQG
jgi:hypothetical protein